MSSDDLPLKYIPPNWETKPLLTSIGESKLSKSVESKGGFGVKDTSVAAEFISPPSTAIITGKGLQPPATDSSASPSEYSLDTIDYEQLPFNGMESITKILDGFDIEDQNATPLPQTPLHHCTLTSTYQYPIYLDIPTIIEELLDTREDCCIPSLRFDVTVEEAEHNWKVFVENNFNLEKILCGTNSVTKFGSEFNNIDLLEKLFHRHPRWKDLRRRLTMGVSYPVVPIVESDRIQDVEAAFTRGNHKSSQKKKMFLENAIVKEINKGWNVILPVGTYNKLPSLVLSPMGVASHTGIMQDGTYETKDRVTHDLSFPGEVSGESVNSRVLESVLEPCMFSYVLLRRRIEKKANVRKLYSSKTLYLKIKVKS